MLVAALNLAAPGVRASEGRTIAVAAAPSLKPAVEELAAHFRAEHPGVAVTAVFGASGSLAAQIAHGAPFDVFLSADAELPAALVSKGLADGPAFTFALGKLVVWVPKTSTLDLEGKGLAALLDPAVRKIAVANPALAPYGRAAELALERAGLLAALRSRIVTGQNVAQAAQFVESGNAQAGFLPLSLAMVPPLSREGRVWAVPPSTYPPIVHAGVIVRGARDAKLARELVAFLLGDLARDVLAAQGYGLPPR